MAGMNSHSWVKVRWMPWLLCGKCGLVALKNDITRWCISHGCDYDEHPGYSEAHRTLSGKR